MEAHWGGALGSDLNIHHSMFKVVVRMLAGRFNDFSGSDCAAGVLERLAHNRARGQSAAISVNTEC